MISVVVIPAGQAQPPRLERLDASDLAGFQGLVGGLIERVGLSEPDACVWVNQEGKARGLAVNPRATAVMWLHNEPMRGWDVFVGDAFITGPADDEGHLTDTPSALVTLLLDSPVVRAQAMEDSGAWIDIGGPFDDPFVAYQHALRLVMGSEDALRVRVVPAAAEITDRMAGT